MGKNSLLFTVAVFIVSLIGSPILAGSSGGTQPPGCFSLEQTTSKLAVQHGQTILGEGDTRIGDLPARIRFHVNPDTGAWTVLITVHNPVTGLHCTKMAADGKNWTGPAPFGPET
jgi:hypothetical protein|tara:strand:+ start:275 stop:619 length:345 start_codon:yes stop_codon:yes gene_type:complete